MHEYRVHTLVDITENGNLQKAFPFNTTSGEIVADKNSLAIARNQNANFNTMLQLLQMRTNITWEQPPQKLELPNLGNYSFGSYYEGKQTSWHFQFFAEQGDVYGDLVDPTLNFYTLVFNVNKYLGTPCSGAKQHTQKMNPYI